MALWNEKKRPIHQNKQTWLLHAWLFWFSAELEVIWLHSVTDGSYVTVGKELNHSLPELLHLSFKIPLSKYEVNLLEISILSPCQSSVMKTWRSSWENAQEDFFECQDSDRLATKQRCSVHVYWFLSLSNSVCVCVRVHVHACVCICGDRNARSGIFPETVEINIYLYPYESCQSFQKM